METTGISNQYMSLDSSSLQELVKSKNASANQKNAVVSQQFESVMIKQFLNDASSRCSKVFSMKMGKDIVCIVISLLMRFRKVLLKVEVLESPQFFNRN